MKKNNHNNGRKMTLTITILSIIILSFLIQLVINTQGVLASNATDYNFTDELEQDRVGIGFVWTAETRTLKITGIKNNTAKVQLPGNSTIDIQGNIENTIKGLICQGNLLIKGNDTASLNITGCSCSTPVGYYSCAFIYDTITLESGNLNIICNSVSMGSSQSTYAGIYAKKMIINDGNFNLEVGGLGYGSQILYAVYVNETTINNGAVHIKADGGTAIKEEIEINGGSVEVLSDKNHMAFKEVPSINPVKDWKILYSVTTEDYETEADIIDIYSIYNKPIVKIYEKSNLGDVNSDGKINVIDCIAILKHIKGIQILNNDEKLRADINGDNIINVIDCTAILKHIKGTKLIK